MQHAQASAPSRRRARQVMHQPRQPCACACEHGGTGLYVFLGPDGGHHRRSNYARRVFRPACDGRYQPAPSRPTRLVIAGATTWPGNPVAMWPPAPATDAGFTPPRGHGIRAFSGDVPLTCWLPVKLGLTPPGLRHSHKTWMAEDGIPEILTQQRLGHEVPGMRGLYAHASDRMRDDLRAALQARWEDSLRARASIHERSPVPLLDELLSPFRGQGYPHDCPAASITDEAAASTTGRGRPEPGGRERQGEDDLPNSSQIFEILERPRPAS